MPSRVIDFEGLWSSDKIGACAAWAQAEYAWLYGLADVNGSFELTNTRVIWGKVAANRKTLSIERLEQVFTEFGANGLLFRWQEGGKTYGHWTNSDRPGRLPKPSHRARFKRLAPDVPKKQLEAYMLCFKNGTSPLRGDALPPVPGQVLELELERGKEGAPENGAPAAQAIPQPSPSAFTGTHLSVTDKQDRLMGEAFPWVDRQAEYRKVDSWLEANPSRRPKKASRFLHNWFAKIPAPSNGAKGPRPIQSSPPRANLESKNELTAAGSRMLEGYGVVR
jgi:hypothetical protein